MPLWFDFNVGESSDFAGSKPLEVHCLIFHYMWHRNIFSLIKTTKGVLFFLHQTKIPFHLSCLCYILCLSDHAVLVTNLLLLILFFLLVECIIVTIHLNNRILMQGSKVMANLLSFCFGWPKQSLVNTSHAMWLRLVP